MAESLVYDLLKESGNEIFKIGYEAILPGLARIEESFKRNSEVGEKIRTIPDFFVIDKLGNPHLVEVKFRWNPEGHEKDAKKLERIKNFWKECFIFYINCSQKPYFRVSKYPFVNKSNQLIAELVRNLEFFNITQELLNKFDVLVEKYLKSTLNNPKNKNQLVNKKIRGKNFLRTMPNSWKLTKSSISIPEDKENLLKNIWKIGKTTACFDVFLWNNEDILFCESKHRGKDKLTKAQTKFIEGALACGIKKRIF